MIIDSGNSVPQDSPLKEQPPKEPSVGKLLNVGVELISGVLAGVGFGLLIDWLFGTSPWGLIILFVLGSVAGMMNVIRAVTPQKKDDGSERKDG